MCACGRESERSRTQWGPNVSIFADPPGVTQELIANMLGVRREGVTEGALKLQKAGLITYTRGRIKVLDRAGLEAQSCECYAVVKKEYDRLLPAIMAK